MPKTNWLQGEQAAPNFVDEIRQELYPAMGMGANGSPNYVPENESIPNNAAFVPDGDGGRRMVVLTPEQERWGLDYVPGQPPPKKRKDPNEGTLVPF